MQTIPAGGVVDAVCPTCHHPYVLENRGVLPLPIQSCDCGTELVVMSVTQPRGAITAEEFNRVCRQRDELARACRIALDCIVHLAEQQAMPDDFWKEDVEDIRAALAETKE